MPKRVEEQLENSGTKLILHLVHILSTRHHERSTVMSVQSSKHIDKDHTDVREVRRHADATSRIFSQHLQLLEQWEDSITFETR